MLQQRTETRQSGSPQPCPATALCKQTSSGTWQRLLDMVVHLLHICPLIKLFLQPSPNTTWSNLPPPRLSPNANLIGPSSCEPSLLSFSVPTPQYI